MTTPLRHGAAKMHAGWSNVITLRLSHAVLQFAHVTLHKLGCSHQPETFNLIDILLSCFEGASNA